MRSIASSLQIFHYQSLLIIMNYDRASLKGLFTAADSIAQKYQTTSKFLIHEDLNDCLRDTAENYIYDCLDRYLIDSDFLQAVLFEALKESIQELIEDFSTHPHQYLKPRHQKQLNEITFSSLNDFSS